MNTKLILLVTIFVIVIFLQMRKNEPFSNDMNEVNKANCLNTTNILNKVNKFEKQSCKEDDSKPNNQVTNDRLTCRNFNEKNIFLSNDRKSHCKGLKDKPKLKKYKKVGDFNGIIPKDEKNTTPSPIENFDMKESTFPFDLNMIDPEFFDLDNK